MRTHQGRTLRRLIGLTAAVVGAISIAACGSSGSGANASASPGAANSGSGSCAGGYFPKSSIKAAEHSAGGKLAPAPSLKGKTIAYIQESSVDYFNKSELGAEMAVKALGGKFVVYNSNGQPATEFANVQDAVAKHVDGILLFSISEGTLASSARVASKAGIPIVDYDGYGPGVCKSLVGAWVGLDSYKFGQLAGEGIAKLIPKGSDVAQVQGVEGRFDVTGYSDGFTDVMKQTGHKIVAEPTSNWDRGQALARMTEIIDKYPSLGGVFCHNDDTAAGCAIALRQAHKKPGDVKMSTENGSPIGLTLIRQGWLQSDVSYSPSQESVLATHMLSLLIQNPKATLPGTMPRRDQEHYRPKPVRGHPVAAHAAVGAPVALPVVPGQLDGSEQRTESCDDDGAVGALGGSDPGGRHWS